MPLLASFVRREREHLERVPVRVAEIECLDTAGVLVPVGKALRTGRRVLYFVLAKPSVCAVHIADNQRHVLEPAVVAAGIGRHGSALRGKILGQIEKLVAEAQTSLPEM